MQSVLLYRRAIEIADRTPPDRDRLIDLLRAVSLVVVVLGHLLMGLVAWPESGPVIGNLLKSSVYLQSLTWLLQVMPLFFIAGGAASAISWRHSVARNEPYQLWVWNRMRRLLAPAVLYLIAMLPLAWVGELIAGAAAAHTLLNISTQLLWFLGVYLLVTALTPALVQIHERFGWRAVFVALVVTAGIDALRMNNLLVIIGLLNFIIVWSMAAILGMRYLDVTANRTNALIRLGLGLAAEIGLVAFLPYPLSLVGMPGDSFSNMAPPSLVLALHCIVLGSLIEVFHNPLQQLVQNVRVWRFTVQVNMAAMTIYLWHIPMIVLITLLTHLIGFDRPIQINDGELSPGAGFWLPALVFWLLAGAAIVAIVQVLWPLEQLDIPGFGTRSVVVANPIGRLLSITGVAFDGVALLLLAGSGLANFPNAAYQFSGISWTNGQAVMLFVLGIVLQKLAIALA